MSADPPREALERLGIDVAGRTNEELVEIVGLLGELVIERLEQAGGLRIGDAAQREAARELGRLAGQAEERWTALAAEARRLRVMVETISTDADEFFGTP